MNQQLGYITLLIDDYDKAIEFFTNKLHFILVEDSPVSETKRWVLVKPNGSAGCCLLLAKASTAYGSRGEISKCLNLIDSCLNISEI